MKVVLTQHAIERFQQRHAPQLSLANAELRLVDLAQGATKLKEKSFGGQDQWRAGEIVLVTKPDGGEHVVVTVLPSKEERVRFEEDLAVSFGAERVTLNVAVIGEKQVRQLLQASAEQKGRDRQQRHIEAIQGQLVEARAHLRSLLKHLRYQVQQRGDVMAGALLDELRRKDPNLLSDDFLGRQ